MNMLSNRKTQSGHRVACGLMVFLVAGLAGSVSAAPADQTGNANNAQSGGQQGAERAVKLLVRSDVNVSHALEVESANAAVANAWKEHRSPGRRPAQPDMILRARVAIEADSIDIARAAVSSVSAQFPNLVPTQVYSTSIPGLFVIETSSVLVANSLADALNTQSGIAYAGIEIERPRKKLGALLGGGGDPNFGEQWHIDNPSGTFAGNDHNILEANNSGVTGAGVVVGVLEAFRGNFNSVTANVNPDLLPNFLPGISQIIDENQIDFSHETAVAGLIGAAGDNGLFGRGVAYNANLVALRNGSNIETGEAWSHELSTISIVNNSWGPINENFPAGDVPSGLTIVAGLEDFEVIPPQITYSGLSRSEQIGIDRGLRLGRSRNGRIFVFSAGNSSHFQGFDRFTLGNAISLPQFGYLDVPDEFNDGLLGGDPLSDFNIDGSPGIAWKYSGMMGDRVEYNRAANLRNTFAIAAIGENNERAGYSTTGTSIIAGGYSGGATLVQEPSPMGYDFSVPGRNITTTDQLDNTGGPPDCTGFFPGLNCSFNGTSASAPIVSGIFALMLEANPTLKIRDFQHIIQQTSIPEGFNQGESYWTNLLGFGTRDPDDGGPISPSFWQQNTAEVIHSDEYGFGIIDAEAAVELARTWTGSGQEIILDTDVLGDLDVQIEDASFTPVGDISDTQVLNVLTPGAPSSIALACVRQNIKIETVEVTVSITGAGAGDLLIYLRSPRGSVSPIAIPRNDPTTVNVQGTEYAYFEYTFSSYKHWGEFAGGTWDLVLQDFRPDDDSPEGTLPTDDDPGTEEITLLGTLGLPGAANHTEKSLVSARIRITGTDVDEPPTVACPPQLTSCPGDINGDGIVTFADMILFIDFYVNNDPFADLTGNGVIDFDDIQAFIAIWEPGFCNSSGLPNRRPDPNVADDGSVVIPI
ncbi:MAG: S8 family serine peptidase [Phycisphaerales bacterium]